MIIPTPDVESDEIEMDRIRQLERERLRALVEKDLAVAGQVHADDFELITPGGAVYSKSTYLDAIASGEINYRVWDPEEIAVRLYGRVALIRYRARIEITVDGQALTPVRTWHTDTYELRDGRWQVVWSHATAISSSQPGALGAAGPVR